MRQDRITSITETGGGGLAWLKEVTGEYLKTMDQGERECMASRIVAFFMERATAVKGITVEVRERMDQLRPGDVWERGLLS